MTSIPILNVCSPTWLAHLKNPSSSPNASLRKYTSPNATAWIFEPFTKTSSKGALFLVLGRSSARSERSSGAASCVLASTWTKSSLMNVRACTLRVVKSTGLRIASVQQSLAIHQPNARATLRMRVDEMDLTLKPARSSSSRFLRISAPPTVVSPISRRKSQRQNWNVILCEWERRQSCWPTRA
ncbi:hypothetical protein GSI_02316 [Ganoderma sinense ZZ0214-1]|uniref:Uncharacterized protein n=1 Tax=Ganoderma sinense ZZ0214-1 TaxID=1077348 RepID=A0A2G8SPT7_9APHY|nr:hypothetical protein GSI_02316 [Ganoderma sinense ZZ0214-1]